MTLMLQDIMSNGVQQVMQPQDAQNVGQAARVIAAYKGDDQRLLQLDEGQLLHVIGYHDGWFLAVDEHNMVGFVPPTYLENPKDGTPLIHPTDHEWGLTVGSSKEGEELLLKEPQVSQKNRNQSNKSMPRKPKSAIARKVKHTPSRQADLQSKLKSEVAQAFLSESPTNGASNESSSVEDDYQDDVFEDEDEEEV